MGNELLADEQVDEVPGGGVLHSDVGAALNQVADDAAAVACGGQEQGASAFGVHRVYAGALLYEELDRFQVVEHGGHVDGLLL